MRVQLNQEATKQLDYIMDRAGYSNHQHCIQVIISTIAKNLRRADLKKLKESASD